DISGADIFGIVKRKRGVEFDDAKIYIAEAINRHDLINESSGAPSGVTIAQVAAAKELSEDYLRSLGWQDNPRYGQYHTKAIEIPYRGRDGVHGWTRIRIRLTGTGKQKR